MTCMFAVKDGDTIKTEDLLTFKSDIYVLITNILIAINNIYNFKDLLSYSIPSWVFKNSIHLTMKLWKIT